MAQRTAGNVQTLLIASVLLLVSTSVHAQQTAKERDVSSQTLQWVRVNSGTTAYQGVLSFPSRTAAFVSSADGARYSLDGGKNWGPLQTPEKAKVSFYSQAVGYAFTDKTVYSTRNGGANWQGPFSDSLTYVDTYCLNGPDTMFLVGDGDIRRSIDGGKTWPMPERINTANLYGINFWKDSKTGVAVGTPILGPGKGQYGAACWTTTDGGNSWSQQYTGGMNDLRAVQFISRKVIVAAGSQGIITRSTDGGTSWVRIDTGVDHYRAIATTGKVSLLVGTGGEIRQSVDSGLTWMRIPSGILTELDDVKMIDDTTAIIVGDKGVVLLSTNSGGAWTPISLPQNPLRVTAYPNPSSHQVSFGYNLPEPQHVTFTITSSEGRPIQTLLSNATQQPGPQSLALPTNQLTSGSYLFHLTSEHYNQSGSFTVLK